MCEGFTYDGSTDQSEYTNDSFCHGNELRHTECVYPIETNWANNKRGFVAHD